MILRLDLARDLLYHCGQDMRHLAGFLPELYREFRVRPSAGLPGTALFAHAQHAAAATDIVWPMRDEQGAGGFATAAGAALPPWCG
ncbi:hypothetical protein ACWCPQ_25445 [Nocardia sp. NPDC001965]